MKLFGILSIVGLAKADSMSVFEARDSVSILATTLFGNLAVDVLNSNGKIIFGFLLVK